MLSPLIVKSDLTLASFGYLPEALSAGSHQPVVVECSGCGTVSRREFRYVGAKHQCPILNGNQKRCCQCKLWKDLSVFSKNKSQTGGVSKRCKKCHNEHPTVKEYERRRRSRQSNSARSGDYKFYINRRIHQLLTSAKRRRIPYNIDTEHMIKLWEEQSGKCFYTKILMVGSGNLGLPTWNSPSVDRLKPELGYVKGNVTWCLFCVNAFKGSLGIDAFTQLIKSIDWWVK